MFLVLLGAPGAGKGTQSQRLVERFHFPHLSTGELLRHAVDEKSDIGRLAWSYMEKGQLVPDDVVLRLVSQRIDQPDGAEGCLFDGFPRTLIQAQSLDDLLRRRGTPLDAVVELKVQEDEVVRRLSNRGRKDDKPEIIRQRLKTFYEVTQPLLDHYRRQGLLHTIDAEGPEQEIFARILAALKKDR